MIALKTGTRFALLNSILYTSWNSSYDFYLRPDASRLAAAHSAGTTPDPFAAECAPGSPRHTR
ncbi:hypothetical protein FJW02_14810 [Pantoea eucalypti]|uniref:Uncharacterized protein n=1 Tax=Pantoea eucalypti TaxID=470933 RepID=A0ABY2ZHV5_9GAMM|nr:hypothetical protein FJW02_14810 [Pantoea eucalypti]